MSNDEGMTKDKSSILAPARAHDPNRGMRPRTEVRHGESVLWRIRDHTSEVSSQIRFDAQCRYRGVILISLGVTFTMF
jgi:hypothetical protein